MSRVLISAAHKSSGKTTISIGLCAALTNKGYNVAPFKKGPDYIDPMWLGQASKRACFNLDFYTMSRGEIIDSFQSRSQFSDISIIEGNKGLYDGLDLDGSNSNAALATLLNAPVVLVIDSQGMTRGIAPLILGYQSFEPTLNIAGVILNKLGGSRHESKLRAVIEHYTDVPVIGAVHRDSSLQILERHLGLVPSNESQVSDKHIQGIAQLVSQQVDLHRILSISGRIDPASSPTTTTLAVENSKSGISSVPNSTAQIQPNTATDIVIGIAQDPAFGFYYPEDIEAFEKAGAILLPINTLLDAHLPDIDGLFIGGGFPETHMPQLQANSNLRKEIQLAIDKGLPVYAECGGLMYLTRSITWHDKKYEMVGALPADTMMHKKPQGRGYVNLSETENCPWGMDNHDLGNSNKAKTTHSNTTYFAHEFHYSSLRNIDDDVRYAYNVIRGSGVNGKNDGIVFKNVLACYAHMRSVQANPWVSRFVEFVRRCKNTPNTQNNKSFNIN